MNYPERRPHPSGEAIPLFLWSLAGVLGMLIWLAMGPAHAPAFVTLTEFACNPQPVDQTGWARGQRASFFYLCRSSVQLIRQRVTIPTAGRGASFSQCARANGTVTIWRQPNPSPYGGFVFQSACGGVIYASYALQAETYAAVQAFVSCFACVLLTLSSGALGYRAYRRYVAPKKARVV